MSPVRLALSFDSAPRVCTGASIVSHVHPHFVAATHCYCLDPPQKCDLSHCCRHCCHLPSSLPLPLPLPPPPRCHIVADAVPSSLCRPQFMHAPHELAFFPCPDTPLPLQSTEVSTSHSVAFFPCPDRSLRLYKPQLISAPCKAA